MTLDVLFAFVGRSRWWIFPVLIVLSLILDRLSKPATVSTELGRRHRSPFTFRTILLQLAAFEICLLSLQCFDILGTAPTVQIVFFLTYSSIGIALAFVVVLVALADVLARKKQASSAAWFAVFDVLFILFFWFAAYYRLLVYDYIEMLG